MSRKCEIRLTATGVGGKRRQCIRVLERAHTRECFHALDHNRENIPYDTNPGTTSAASYFHTNRGGGVRKGRLRGKQHRKEGNTIGTGGDNPTFPPSPLPSIISFPIPLSPLTRDSFLLASHHSPPLCSSPSPGTKHTPDRLPWKRLTHTLSLSLSCSGNACILSPSSISIPLSQRQQGQRLLKPSGACTWMNLSQENLDWHVLSYCFIWHSSPNYPSWVPFFRLRYCLQMHLWQFPLNFKLHYKDKTN